MQKYTAIILSHCNVGEFDRLYSFYTREKGIVRAIGRGARKQAAKLAGHLEPGTLSEVYIARSRGMGQIASAITLESFENVKNNLERLQEILKIFRFFGKNFAEEEKDEKIFNLLEDFLKLSNDRDFKKILLEAFWWKLFDALGHRPEAMKCVECGAKLEETKKNFFDMGKGGIICKKCFASGIDAGSITSTQIKLLRIILANSLEKISKVKVEERELAGLGRIREKFGRYNF